MLPAIGAGVTLHGNVAYVAYPIFDMYQAMGQPLYRNVVRRPYSNGCCPILRFVTDLPTAGRATLTRQDEQKRHVLHLLYGPPQVRGKRVPLDDGTYRVMEMIEDIPAIGPVSARVRLPRAPARVYDAHDRSGRRLEPERRWHGRGDGSPAAHPCGTRLRRNRLMAQDRTDAELTQSDPGQSDAEDDGSGRRRPSTIIDVANEAGVAIGTVSRYLNGLSVRPGNRDLIETAIQRLGYRRNALAAAMKSDLTNTVGFMVPALSEFHSSMLEQLSRRLRTAGRALLDLLPQ